MKKIKFSALFLFFVTLLSVSSCSDFDLNEPVGKTSDVINRDSELYDMLSRVADDGVDPLEQIVCLDFIYPFAVLIYNEDLQVIGTQILVSDVQFSAFLGELPLNQSISISYPISTTLADGTVFSVNSNEELKAALESCSKEDIISYCNALFGGCNCPQEVCVWEVLYALDTDNQYTTGLFEASTEGILNFKYNEMNYRGTWVFLFVADKLHININLEGNSEVAQYWNINREVTILGNQIKITNLPKNILLTRSCQATTPYEVGDEGPAGGIVFYDKGTYSNGWRYMEAAATDGNALEWGCKNATISNASSGVLGKGFYNSAQIATFHDNLANFYSNPAVCNSLNNGTVAARAALLFENNGYKDWLLPSEAELQLLYENLHANGNGNFVDGTYWSSTQTDAQTVKAINFIDGSVQSISKIPTLDAVNVRVIRYF